MRLQDNRKGYTEVYPFLFKVPYFSGVYILLFLQSVIGKKNKNTNSK